MLVASDAGSAETGSVMTGKHKYGLKALLAAGLCLPLSACTRASAKVDAKEADAIPVRAVPAVSRDVPVEVNAVGNVETLENVAVKPRVAGQIEQVAFAEGQTVAKGQLLFRIDRQTLEQQAAGQQAELARDAALEDQARAVAARDSAAERQNRANAGVAEKLGALGVLSGQRVDQLMTASDTSHAALASDQAAMEAAAGTTRADRVRLAQTRLELGRTDVVAPIAGRAGAILVQAGNLAQDSQTTLVTLMQLSPIAVSFGLPEQSLADVQRLNRAGTLLVEASAGSGQAAAGKLMFIDNTVDRTSGTVRLKAIFPNAGEALWPGEFVAVRLRLRIEPGRMVVPTSAIENGLDGKYVWLAHSGKAIVAPVTVLRTYKPPQGAEQAVLGSGIRLNDLVITEGQLRLTEGSRVALLGAPIEEKGQP